MADPERKPGTIRTDPARQLRLREAVAQRVLSGVRYGMSGMPQNFLDCDREQAFLMPPSLRDWLPSDHLAWFVIQTVGGLDLEAFYAAYRPDGHGRAAYEPAMMVSLLTYSYATGEYSSRGIERHCRQDIAYRVITANRVPDHATVARFVCRHQDALAGLFSEVLELCDRAGLVACGVVALDGTKLRGNATRETSVDFGQIARELIDLAVATDEAEDEVHGDARGDELPEELQTDEGRRAWLARELAARRDAQRQVDDDEDGDGDGGSQPGPEPEFDAEQIVARVQGRDGWLLEGKRQLDRERWQDPAPVTRSREDRLWDGAERLEADLAALGRGNVAYERWRETAVDRLGRSLAGNRLPKPYQPPAWPQTTVNLSDPDTHLMKGHRVFVQGYNAQAVVAENQIVIAAEISTEPVDFSALGPLISAAGRELERANVSTRPQIAIADAGFWNEQQMDKLAADGIAVLVPPESGRRKGQRPGWTGGRSAWMRHLLDTDQGRTVYRLRRQVIEPVFGHTKHNRKFTQFHRRGRAAVRTEWRLLMMTHNLTKLYRHQLATTRA
jgi:transposase